VNKLTEKQAYHSPRGINNICNGSQTQENFYDSIISAKTV